MELSKIKSKIYEIRDKKVMLDYDLADMFQLTNQEFTNLMSQNVISSWGGTRKLPYAFTEQGVAMLSGLINSDIAISVNIGIMRAFVVLRQYALGYAELNQKIENYMIESNMQFNEIYQAIEVLAEQKKELDMPRNPIGY